MDLILVRNNEPVTTSLLVAEKFNKRHDRVLRAIENLLGSLPKNGVSYFFRGTYKDKSGKSNPMYYMTQDGFALLVMGFTGKEALSWKLKYIDAFNQMRKLIESKSISADLQKQSIQFLHDNLELPQKTDYIKANTIANKATSTKYGYSKSVKKEAMTSEMLADRDVILKDTVELMAMKDKFNLDIHVSEKIYEKYGC